MNHDATTLLYRQGLSFIDAQTAPVRLGIVNAAADPLLAILTASAHMFQLQQTRRDESLALADLGLDSCEELSGTFDCVLLVPAKQRAQTLGWMASAMKMLSDNGMLIVCCPNRMGARTYEKKLGELSGNVSSTSKSKCRIFSAKRSKQLNEGLAEEWVCKSAPQVVPEMGLYSRPGLFSWDRPDPGSCLLLDHLPSDLSGSGMDLGCGLGFLAAGILQRSEHIDTLHLVDVERLALDCARLNLEPFKDTRLHYHWLDASSETLPDKLDWIILNPPFHRGREQAIELGQKIIAAACGVLKPGGKLYLVANVHLPYEGILKAHLKTFRQQDIRDGFKLIGGRK